MTPDATPRDDGGAAPAAATDVDLAVVVLHPRDAEGATAGGADRLVLQVDPGAYARSPEPAAVSAVLRETDLPVWVTLHDPSLPFHRLVALGEQFVELGVAGLAYGFLDEDLAVDRASCAEVCAETGGTPWILTGFDETLDTTRAWRDVVDLPGLDSVVTAGSTRGLAHGVEDVITQAQRDPRVAALVTAAGGLTPDVVPWLVRAGVRRFAIGRSARPGGSWTRASVGADHVRSWRMLLDDALSRALGLPVD